MPGGRTPLLRHYDSQVDGLEPGRHATHVIPEVVLEDDGSLPAVKSGRPAWSCSAVKHRLRQLKRFTGPGWLMSIAYVDPGNLEADLQSGALFGYELLWTLLLSTALGLCFQVLALRLGCVTRKHLAEHCGERFAPFLRAVSWIAIELAVVGSDIQEVIGCSIGLKLLLGVPLWAGVLATAASAFVLLYLERVGSGWLEAFFGALITMLAVSMLSLFLAVSPSSEEMVEGIVVPRLRNAEAVKQVVAMTGCVIMPHNLFLHSALVQSRDIQEGEEREAVRYFTIESCVALLTSFLINMACVAVFAKGFFGKPEAAAIGLQDAGQYLGTAFVGPLSVIWGLGLIASGQSSTMTGAYAGQFVMQGYLQLQVKPWKRMLLTRGLALLPTFAVAVLFRQHSNSLDQLNTALNILQALVLPFALSPLLKFASDAQLMGQMALPAWLSRSAWGVFALLMSANLFLLSQSLSVGSLTSGCGVALLVAAATYFGLVLYTVTQ